MPSVLLPAEACERVSSSFSIRAKAVVMQFLCNGLEEDFTVKKHAAGSAGTELDLLTQSSGKMLLLHKLLPKLKAEGHKVCLKACCCQCPIAHYLIAQYPVVLCVAVRIPCGLDDAT